MTGIFRTLGRWLGLRDTYAVEPQRRPDAQRPFPRTTCPQCGRAVAMHRDNLATRKHEPCGIVRLAPICEAADHE